MRSVGHRVLAPGVRVLPRGRHHVQVGLLGDPLVLRRSPEVDRVVAALEGRGTMPPGPATRALLARLDDHGLLASTLPSARVVVAGSLGEADCSLAEALTHHGLDAGEVVTHGLHLAVGRLDHAVLDEWLRAGLPHLVVRTLDGRLLVGPYVVPGVTACVRCLDAHAAEDARDGGWADTLEAYADLAAAPRPDGLAEPLDPAMVQLALGWAVLDLAAAAAGRRPSTWSAQVEVGPLLTDLRHRTWWRHPSCGCGWSAAGTLEA